jgi:hypothetical protein
MKSFPAYLCLPNERWHSSLLAGREQHVSNYIATTVHGKLETTKVTRAVPVMSDVWKVGTLHAERMAIAMIDHLPDDNALVGYFEVEEK